MKATVHKIHLARKSRLHLSGVKPKHVVFGIAILGFVVCAAIQYLQNN
ncbi:hypothetical protein [Soonwooa sp.]|nr:hypothetical protein [Soonwooa sp.]